MVSRAFQNLEAELVRELRAPEVGPVQTAELLDRVSRTLGDRGFARLLASLVLSDRASEPDADGAGAHLRAAAPDRARGRSGGHGRALTAPEASSAIAWRTASGTRTFWPVA